MSKLYGFDKENLIKLLSNWNIEFNDRMIQWRKDHKTGFIDQRIVEKWIEEFLDTSHDTHQVRVEDILDDVDEIVQKTHGISLSEYAKKKVKSEN